MEAKPFAECLPLRVGFEHGATCDACKALPEWTPIVGRKAPLAFGAAVALAYDPEHAAEIVRAVNCHEQLLAACKLALKTINGLADQQAMRDNWYQADEQVIAAAVAKAEGRE